MLKEPRIGTFSNWTNDTAFLYLHWKNIAIYPVVSTAPNPILICADQKHILLEDFSSKCQFPITEYPTKYVWSIYIKQIKILCFIF